MVLFGFLKVLCSVSELLSEQNFESLILRPRRSEVSPPKPHVQRAWLIQTLAGEKSPSAGSGRPM